MAAAKERKEKVLPSGFITFVFTDIEGSTRLYKALGEERAGDVFDLHNELLRAAWDNHGGYEIHTEGDSFFVVFEAADDAVAACAEVQQLITNAEWPDGGEVRVRIGIHCGVAVPRNGDYMALAVHQAARVMSAANGGQLLISDQVADALSEPPAGGLVRTGAFRLRDFDEIPVLHRVDVAGVPVNDVAPRATPAVHHNLMPAITSFIGRDDDVAALRQLLAPGSLVTLVGLGGMGKTRLATEVGLQVADDWHDGVWMVELADIVDPDLIADEIASTIGASATPGANRWTDVLTFVDDTKMLLVLDNTEHLTDACARLVSDLLRQCPNVAVVTTSREPLNCPGEAIYRLDPLDAATDLDEPTDLPAVELFIDRANTITRDFEWTPAAVADVVAICKRLDGLPLAIEVAAAQSGVLRLDEILSGLSNRFRLLRSRNRTLPDRQRTMEGLLGWSYQLLTEAEQRAFRRLAVFASSFSLDAAEAALAGDGIVADDVPELVWALADKSLVVTDSSDSATRYRLFESVQQYAMRLLIDNDDPVRCATQHANWLLDRIAPWHVNDRRWLGTVAVELANIRAVVDLIAETEPELAQQLLCSVARYHDTMQSYGTGIEELRDVAASSAVTPTLVALLAELAYLHLRQADTDAATEVLDRAASIQAQVGPCDWNTVALERSQCELAIRTENYAAASELATTTLARGVAPRGEAHMWSVKGIAESLMGNGQAGIDALERALAVYIELDDVGHIVVTRSNVAEASWRQGLIEKSARMQRRCLDDALVIGHQVALANSLLMAARIAALRENWSDAIVMQARGEVVLLSAGHRLYADDHDELANEVLSAQQALGEETVSELTQAGRALPILEAVAIASSLFESELTDPEAQIL